MRTTRSCPGCGLEMPLSTHSYEGYYNTSPECWSVYEEVLGTEFQNVLIYSKVHQLTVDAYAVQHAGAEHKDKSVCIHLAGLHLWLEQGVNSREVPPLLQRLASRIEQWPHFEPPARIGPLTVFDVASAGLPEEHMDCVRAWADQIWEGWRARHADVQALVERFL